MNLTKDLKEKKLILENANEILHSKTRTKPENMSDESYFISGEELALFRPSDMMEYSPESPMDLDNLLNILWKKRNTYDMVVFNKACVIAAMKNRHKKTNSEIIKVSSTVYEF